MPPRADSILRAFVAAGPIVRLDVQQRRVCVWCGGPMATESPRRAGLRTPRRVRIISSMLGVRPIRSGHSRVRPGWCG